jgi:lipoyl(octanoyl) transferase
VSFVSHKSQSPAVETFLLDRIDFDVAQDLQQRLVHEVGQRGDGQIILLFCEHPTILTVGRGGSPGEIAMQSGLLRNQQIDIRWVNRGGGCQVHCPGQLAIYPIIPLQWHGFSVGEFVERLHAGLLAALDDLNVLGRLVPGRHGVWGRTGHLATVGAAVRNWVTYFGAYLNVCPPMGLFRLVETDPAGRTTMSCLVAERRAPVRMTAVRAALVQRLTEAFGCDRYHLFTGHPMLRRVAGSRCTDDC